jgi:hypothetical protein
LVPGQNLDAAAGQLNQRFGAPGNAQPAPVGSPTPAPRTPPVGQPNPPPSGQASRVNN